MHRCSSVADSLQRSISSLLRRRRRRLFGRLFFGGAEVLADRLHRRPRDAVLVDLVGQLLVVRTLRLAQRDLALALQGGGFHQRAGEDLTLLVEVAGADILNDVERRFRDRQIAAVSAPRTSGALAL